MGFTKGQNVYVSSLDSRHKGYNATITSIGILAVGAILRHFTDKEQLKK